MTAVIPTPRNEALDDNIYALTELEIQADEVCAEELAPLRLRRSLGLFFFFLVLVFFSWMFSSMEAYLTDASKMPMSALIIQGDREYVSDDDIRTVLLQKPAIENYFSVNVDDIQNKIESLPWVYHASVRKSWPDLLRVYIQEQPVVAVWNDTQLLNEDGIVFDADINSAPKSLVKLYSPNDKIEQTLAKFNEFNGLLQLNNYKIVKVSLNLRNAITVELSNGIMLRLGRENAISRIQRYIDYVAVLDKEKIAYIDLRYDTGFSVGWKNDNKE
ncbi:MULTISPECIES: cell division protein FtsQ/DivIB [unclassified Moritella]|uniref:cell division protein FtsQ/DivIB n=1 Tax=unclassified Moritella TaxID=2637987 RepID=UPI001BABBDB5|nr:MULTISPECIES: cell division protein FtsQ/DivIB [unclassified Moritella]QUM83260.1 FtsQ-type POTRA domain-containing protein [Moritella sp. 28]QUM87562.1 FtsQ-type POTRA domain-containing protein [Moritella sp. 36]